MTSEDLEEKKIKTSHQLLRATQEPGVGQRYWAVSGSERRSLSLAALGAEPEEAVPKLRAMPGFGLGGSYARSRDWSKSGARRLPIGPQSPTRRPQ